MSPAPLTFLKTGDKAGLIGVHNFSTATMMGSTKVPSAVTAIAWQENRTEMEDQILYVGCQTGELHWFKLDNKGAVFTPLGSATLTGAAITSIQWRAQHTHQWCMPSLLISQMRAPTRLLSIQYNSQTEQQLLEVHASFPPAPQASYIRSTFCPLISNRSDNCIVTGMT